MCTTTTTTTTKHLVPRMKHEYSYMRDTSPYMCIYIYSQVLGTKGTFEYAFMFLYPVRGAATFELPGGGIL